MYDYFVFTNVNKKQLPMKNLQLLLSCLAISISIWSCQNHEHQLEEDNIDIGNLSNLSQAVYREIKPFDVIMVGEMHGTQEPAKLVQSLAKLIAKNEGEVYVGVEIPKSMIDLNNNELSVENLSKTAFFTMEESDGRNGQSWFDLMVSCGADDRINVFYIDNYTTSSRDSSMYLEVKQIRELHPERKILTLSGNVHNSLIPMYGENRMGMYLIDDNDTFKPSKIMSINHLYKGGTMRNKMKDGFKVRKAGGVDLTETSKYKNFLSKMPEDKKAYNYFFYTEKVNHSEQVKID